MASEQHSTPILTGSVVEDTNVVAKIEAIFASFIDDAITSTPLCIPMAIRSVSSTASITTLPHKRQPPIHIGSIKFPGATPEEAWRFTVVARILELIHEALISNTIMTKRDIYYRDPTLFLNQSVVDRHIDTLALTFGVGRTSLNVVAGVKGLIVGCFKATRKDGTIIDGTSDPEGLLMPHVHELSSISTENIKWILVIEKEATFRTLSSSTFYHNNPTIGNGIILTGRGYPDLSTRSFLHHLSTITPPQLSIPPPIYALVDYDPDGISIMSTYAHGSIALSHENHHTTVPSLRWLGIKSRDLVDASLVDDSSLDSCLLSPLGLDVSDVDEIGRLRLTPRERKKAAKMLERGRPGEREGGEWRREVQVMLMLGVKAEIQILNGREGGLERWVEREIGRDIKREI